MDETIKYFVGLDVHKESISVAVCKAGREPSRFLGTLRSDLQGVLKMLDKYGPARQVRVVYEAGPAGYGLYRELSRRGYCCDIIAASSSLMSRCAGERIKTNRRNCARLAELSRSGELKTIREPDEGHEAMRNLSRAREDAINMRMRARQQLKAFLLRQERHYAGKTSWTSLHQRWLADQRFDHPADQIAMTEYQLAAQVAELRVQRLTVSLRQAIHGWRFEAVVDALRTLRGISTVSAIGVVCEIGNVNRFASANQLMDYLRLVPSDHSNRSSVCRGSTTETSANANARHVVLEAA